MTPPAPSALGFTRAILLHPDGTPPTTVTRRRDGSWSSSLVPRGTVTRFAGPAAGSVQVEQFERSPDAVVHGRAVVAGARRTAETFSERISRVVTFGPRWQCLHDTGPHAEGVRVRRRTLEDGVMPVDLVVDRDGLIRGQVVWKGEAVVLEGFTQSVDDSRLSLSLAEFHRDPDRAEGMLAVTRTWAGDILVRDGRVERAERTPW